MHATRTSFAPRSDPSSAPTHSNSSVFTFLIALLILLCTSAAVVLRAVLMRRRFRRRMQNALDAGILLPVRPLAEDKPELWEIWVRGATNLQDWDDVMPLCATKVPDGAALAQKTPPRATVSYRPPPAGRLMEMLGHPPTMSSVTVRPADPVQEPSKSTTMQVVVLISMPSQQSTIPPHDPSAPPASPKGKQKDLDADIHHDDADADSDMFPDLLFGVSTFPLPREDDHGLST